MFKRIFILLAMISLFYLHFGQQLDYGEIKALGASCSPHDTCSLGRAVHEDNLFKHMCECKLSCRKHGTCCFDSPYNRPNLRSAFWPDTPEESCRYLMGTYLTLIVIHKCKESWKQDPEVKSLCETPIYSYSFEDPLAVLPVTNPKTSKTYKNYFCALCHDDTADLVYWNIKVTKEVSASDNEEIKNTHGDVNFIPIFTYKNHQWYTSVKRDPKRGSMSENGSNDERVSMMFTYPPSLDKSIISCSASLVTDCHPDWTDETIRKKCRSYMGMIYSEMPTPDGFSSTRRFRNVHCAICNFAGKTSNFRCSSQGRDSDEKKITMIRRKIFSFSMLLDVNTSDGDKVGKANKCMSGEVFDPFFKSCRALRCTIPGYRVRNGKCEPP